MKLTLYPLEGSVSKGFTPSVRPEGPLPAPICVAGCFCESMSQLKHFRKAFPDHLSRSGVSPQPSTSVPVFIYLSLFFFFSWGRFFFYSSRKKSTQKHTKETQKNTVKVPQTRNSSRLFFFLLHHFPHNIFFIDFQLEDNCFTILCWLLPYINMNLSELYLCPLPLEPLPLFITLI